MSSQKYNSSKLADFINSFENKIMGEIRTDKVSRALYSTDASIYQIEPMGVVFPKDLDDISACVEAARDFGIPVLPRGSGTSLAGQAIGPGFIMDCSRHLNRIIDIDHAAKTATVEPGVILSALNQSLEKFDLQFGPDPASAERATMGGVIGNNATGAHSIRYGMSADHLLKAEVVLSDGSIANFENMDLNEAQRRADQPTIEGNFYQAAISIRDNYAEAIEEDWPRTWRRSSGYNLNYLLPWSPSQPPQWSTYNQQSNEDAIPYPPIRSNELNLAALMAGSEGTLGIIRRAQVRLVPKPRMNYLVLLAFTDVISACDAVGEILQMLPSAVELIPKNMIRLAQTVPSYARQISFLKELFQSENGIPNLLAVEFAGENSDQLRILSEKLVNQNEIPALIADDAALQQRIWNVRKVGLGLLMSIPGDTKPISFIEDLSVPVEKLSEFVSEMGRILSVHNSEGDFYAHASAGCLHLRPLINLKSHQGVKILRDIAREAINLIDQLGGVPSGEHGDGIARSEWLEAVFGSRISAASRILKNAADPNGILNPGKIIDPIPMDTHLRYKQPYSPKSWQPVFDFSKQAGMIGAVELCNGAGVCRKSEGVMCPSFQATREELHSTRGRANLLRALFAGNVPANAKINNKEVFEALDLCLACKGCKAECPSGVDIAKLKYEFLERYYSPSGKHRRPLRDYLFAYIGDITRFGASFNPITNYLLKNINQLNAVESWLGLSPQRNLPLIAKGSLHSIYKNSQRDHLQDKSQLEKVLFLSDPFTEYYHPENGLVAVKLLEAAGCKVAIIPEIGSGRTMLSKGFVKSARKHAINVIEAINELDDSGHSAIVGIEPSEIYTLRDEYVDFFPEREDVKSIADRAMMIDEFLIRNYADSQTEVLRIDILAKDLNRQDQEVLLHGHCYQKSQPPAKDGYPIGVQATAALLERVGYKVELIEAGCCGMAGAFGYETEHYDLSMEIGELSLFPRVRDVDDQIIAAAGYSCMTQIKDGTGREAIHPVSLIHERVTAQYE